MSCISNRNSNSVVPFFLLREIKTHIRLLGCLRATLEISYKFLQTLVFTNAYFEIYQRQEAVTAASTLQNPVRYPVHMILAWLASPLCHFFHYESRLEAKIFIFLFFFVSFFFNSVRKIEDRSRISIKIYSVQKAKRMMVSEVSLKLKTAFIDN